MEWSILEAPPLVGPPRQGLFDDVFLVNQTNADPLFPQGFGVGSDSIVSIRDGSPYKYVPR
jgi:hypothetical protein